MKKEGTFSDDDDDLHSLGTGVGVALPVFRWAAANTVRPRRGCHGVSAYDGLLLPACSWDIIFCWDYFSDNI